MVAWGTASLLVALQCDFLGKVMMCFVSATDVLHIVVVGGYHARMSGVEISSGDTMCVFRND